MPMVQVADLPGDRKRAGSPFTIPGFAEFLDESKPLVSLWDDNVLAYPKWRDIFSELEACGKPYEFKQGLDIRLLDKAKADILGNANYTGDYIFAFDNLSDKDLVVEKLTGV